ncbi:MAG: ABC transporter permease [Solirubrobacteraceae bacterium]
MGRLALRWGWRDFRGRWVQIVATALILAVGIGALAGLGGMRDWRVASADQSLAATRAHDLRVDLPDGAFAPAGRLRAALRRLPAGLVAGAEERLVVPSQIDASRPGRPLLVPARLVGVPVRAGGQAVDEVAVRSGRGLSAAPAARGVVLDWNFAHHYGLAGHGRIRLAGLGPQTYTGTGVSPQYFLIVDEAGISGAQSGLAVVYVPLHEAQRAARRPGQVNELLVRAVPGTSPGRLTSSVRRALAAALPGSGATLTTGGSEGSTRILYRDARNDQKTFWAFAMILLVGAALAAFNLVSRVVEAQRREIGIGMALGAEPRTLAARPLALGLEIGVLGAAFGVPMGIGLSALIHGLTRDLLPLPAYASTFPAHLYVIGGALSIAIGLLAAAWPVRRALAVAPVEAIRTGFRAARGGGATGLLRRLPGRPVATLPLRNLARTPRRTIMTLVGLGATITAVVAVLAMVDSIAAVADRQAAAVLSSAPDRLDVVLSAPSPVSDPGLRRLARTPGVARAETGLTVRGRLGARDGRGFPVALVLFNSRSRIWQPSVTAGEAAGRGVLISAKAASDLGVSVGDTVLLTHPRAAAGTFVLVTTPVRVAGIHRNPVRAFVYADRAEAVRLGLSGIANTMMLAPRSGLTPGSVERALFGRPGIASVAPAAAGTEALRTAVDSFNSAIQLVAVITLGLALLVAFTSTSVSLEERRREYATMFAFGLPARTGLRVAMTESLVTGALGTIAGLAFGFAVAGWIVGSLMPDTFPDLDVRTTFSASSLATTLAVGIIAVTAAPLLSLPRLRRMDVPSTLRVME